MQKALFFSLFLAAGLLVPCKTHAQQFITERTPMLTEANQFGRVVATLEAGLEIEVLQSTTRSSWVQIKTPQGRIGWVRAAHTSLQGRRGAPVVAAETQPFEDDPKLDLWTLDMQDKVSLALRAAYALEILPEMAHGAAMGLSMHWGVAPQWSVGFSAGWNGQWSKEYFDNDLNISRQSHQLPLLAELRFHSQGFAWDFTFGADLLWSGQNFRDSSGQELSWAQSGCSNLKNRFAQRFLMLGTGPSFRFGLGASSFVEAFAHWRGSFRGDFQDRCELNESGLVNQMHVGSGVTLLW